LSLVFVLYNQSLSWYAFVQAHYHNQADRMWQIISNRKAGVSL